MAILDVSNLTTRFHTRNGIVHAVEDVSFKVDKGETLGIVGESGSGKSVACYSLLGLLPMPPASIERGSAVFDGRDPAQLAAYGLTLPDMATDAWRDLAREPGGAPTQCLATALIAAGYVGLLVPSFARGASPKDSNLVLWKWGNTPVARLRLIDDQKRLGNQAPPAP